jgi:DNA-binding winged helix-turn-helix (wHTH) protein
MTAYRFGSFRVDTREQSLTRGGEAVAITPKVFETLVVFLRHAGRLLTKEELLEAVWPDTSVEDANLTVNVSTLRRLLADSDMRPCIETVARRGYRFVLPVEAERDAAAARAGGRSNRPASIQAQELYARANQAAHEADHWETARDLYQACVDESPEFAPAWARLARCHRLIAKYTSTRALRDFAQSQATAAFERALELEPSLSLTHSLYAQLEVDVGHASDAAVRLLRLLERHGPDAEAFAGLVHALRFCGLLEASRAAHDRARGLDPTIITSVAHTAWLLGDYETALRETTGDIGYLAGLALASLGREQDAVAALRWRERGTRDNRARAFLVSLRALLEGHREESLVALQRAEDEITDPEARYYIARSLAHLGSHDAAMTSLRRVVDDGYFCYPVFASDAWLAGVRGSTAFAEILDAARARHESAASAFHTAGGDALLAGS